jgi:hypothetical protein
VWYSQSRIVERIKSRHGVGAGPCLRPLNSALVMNRSAVRVRSSDLFFAHR